MSLFTADELKLLKNSAFRTQFRIFLRTMTCGLILKIKWVIT